MDVKNQVPDTLLEAAQFFSSPDISLAFVARLRWPDGVVTCPRCEAAEATFLSTRRLWKCRSCKKQFSAKVGTIFEDSPIPLEKWLPALWLVVNCKNGISSYELGRALGVSQHTAWFMGHRLRLAVQAGGFRMLSGEVEVDETYIGGKARFMHKDKRAEKITGTGGMGKAAVMGLLERHGEDGHSRVKAKVVPNVRRKTLAPAVREQVVAGSELFTDALPSYNEPAEDYTHQVIDHAESYAKGKIHTNGLENFWSLLKRRLKGTYVSVEPFHLFRYLDEQVFRFNSRKMTDGLRFLRAAAGIIGKRLTYSELTGAEVTGT
ncbi:MAG TPA: IS1595 family transposase [Thermoanaerobaculia bacterium]|nr:IS1595 family transposase [Thermoanaerobaculia bacterium]